MVTGGFVVGYHLRSFGKYYRLEYPLGIQYFRDENTGRIHPILTDWIWGGDVSRIIKLDKAKVVSITFADAKLIGMYIDYNTAIAKRFAEERQAMKEAVQITGGSENNSSEPVENQRFPGEVGLTEEEQIARAVAYVEFMKPTLH